MKSAVNSKAQRLWLIIFMGVVSATGPLSLDMYLPGLPQMQKYFGSSASTLQLSITFCLLGLAIGQLFVGPISDRYGRKIPLIVGFALYALTSLLIIFAENVWVFVALRLLQGLAGSTGQVLSRAVARDLFEGHELTRFYAMLMAVNGIFPIISPILGGMLIPIFHWEGIFALLVIIGILVVLGVIFTIPETLPIARRKTANMRGNFVDMLKIFGHRRFMLIALTQGLIMGSLFSYIAASSFVFQVFFHMSVGQFSILYAINGLGIIIGSNLPSYFSEWLDEKQMLLGGLYLGVFASILMVASLLFTPNMILVIIPLFIVILSVGIISTVGTSLAMNSEDQKNAGSASAVLGLCTNLIGALASPISGLMGADSYAPMAILIFACEIGGLVLFSFATRKQKS